MATQAEPKYAIVPKDEEGAQATAAVAVALNNTDTLSLSGKQTSSTTKQDKNATLEVEGQPWTRGARQDPAYRDKWFAVAFLLHLIAVISTSIVLWPNWANLASADRRLAPSYEETYTEANNNQSASEESKGDDIPAGMLGAIVAVSVILAPILSLVALSVMSKNAIRLLEFSLIFAVALNAILMIVALVFGVIFSAVIHGLFALLLAFYARSTWHRIPYAAANLKAAVGAVQLNLGVMLVALSSMVVFCLWIVTWTVAFGGAIMQPDLMLTTATEEHCYDDGSCTEPGDAEVTGVGFLLYVLFLLSFYWTHQIIQVSCVLC